MTNIMFDKIYTSFLGAFAYQDDEMQGLLRTCLDSVMTANDRAVSGWIVAQFQFLREAKRLDVPILMYDRLIHDDTNAIESQMEKIFADSVDTQTLAQTICESRSESKRTERFDDTLLQHILGEHPSVRQTVSLFTG